MSMIRNLLVINDFCVVVDLHYTFVKIIAEGLKCDNNRQQPNLKSPQWI